VTAACRWAWRLSPEPKRWRKETAPTRGRGDGSVAWFEQSSCSISARTQREKSWSPPRRPWAGRRALPAAVWAVKSPTAARARAGSIGRRRPLREICHEVAAQKNPASRALRSVGITVRLIQRGRLWRRVGVFFAGKRMYPQSSGVRSRLSHTSPRRKPGDRVFAGWECQNPPRLTNTCVVFPDVRTPSQPLILNAG